MSPSKSLEAAVGDSETEVLVELRPDEVDAVVEVIDSYLNAMPSSRRAPYLELLEQARSGRIEGEAVDVLEQVCALALETGQARRIGLAEVETLVTNVFRRTPAGRARTQEVTSVNQALAQLTGLDLLSAKVTWTRPGRYVLTLGVTGFDLSLVIAQDGLEVQNLTTT